MVDYTPEQQSQIVNLEKQKVQGRIEQINTEIINREARATELYRLINQARGNEGESYAREFGNIQSTITSLRSESGALTSNLNKINQGYSYEDLQRYAGDVGYSEYARIQEAEKNYQLNKQLQQPINLNQNIKNGISLTPEQLKGVSKGVMQDLLRYGTPSGSNGNLNFDYNPEINREINLAIQRGDIQQFSGNLGITDTEMAKAKLLNKVTGSEMPKQYGEYYKGITPKGINLLNKYNKQEKAKLAPSEQLVYNLPKPYKVPREYNLRNENKGKTLLGGGGGADIYSYINIGTPVSLKSPEELIKSYQKNIQTSNNQLALLIATLGTEGAYLYLGKKEILGRVAQTGTGYFNKLPVPVKNIAVKGLKGANIYFTGESIKNALNPNASPENRIFNLGMAGLGSIDIVGDSYNIYQKALSQKILTESVPSLFNKEVIQYARNRATFLPEVIDESGKSLGVVLAKNKFGEFISIGGGVDKGESISKAVQREAFEESGIKASQIKNFRQIDKYANPEEIQNVYTGTITKKDFDSLIPKSDVTEFKLFNQKEFEKILGSTAKNPRYVMSGNFIKKSLGIGDNVRVTEATLLGRFNLVQDINKELSILSDVERNKLLIKAQKELIKKFGNNVKGLTNDELLLDYKLLQKGKLPTASYIKTPKGNLYLAMQSRYNVEGVIQEKYYNNIINKPIYKYSDKEFISKVMGITNEQEQRNILKITQRIGRKDFNNPQLIVSGTQNKIVLNAKGELEVMGGKAVRGGADVIYFQPPIAPNKEGYVGLSYVLGGSNSDIKLGLLPTSSKKTILYGKSVIDKELFDLAKTLKEQDYSMKETQKILNKFAKEGKVGATAKSVYGVETEFGATVGTRFEFTGEKQFNVIEKQLIETRNIRRIVNREKLGEVNSLYKDFERTNDLRTARKIEKITGINPSEIRSSVKTIPITDFTSVLRKSFEKMSKSVKEFSIPKENYRLPKIKELSISTYNKETIKNNEKPKSIEKQIYNETPIKFQEYIYPKETIRNIEKPINYKENINSKYNKLPETIKIPKINITPIFPKPIISIPQRQQSQVKKSLGQGYDVYGKVLKSNKFSKINSSPVTRGRAEDIGSYYVSNTLARSFKIVKTSKSAEQDQFYYIPVDYHKYVSNQIREFNIKKGKAYNVGEIFIQKNPFLLNTIGEKRQIKAFQNQVKNILR